jgi:hypothetical protein
MSWTMGMVGHQVELNKAAEGKKGMAYVKARLSALNHKYCWCKDTHDTLWPVVNRHLWRISAMYRGGDCYIAGWPGAVPHQRLWPMPTLGGGHAIPAYRVPLKQRNTVREDQEAISG